jgi:hypothetical protein
MRLDPQGLKATAAAASSAPPFQAWNDSMPVSEMRRPAFWADDELPYTVPGKKPGKAFARKGAVIDSISTSALWKGLVEMNAKVGIVVYERVEARSAHEGMEDINQLVNELKERM